MLDINLIRKNSEFVKEKIRAKGINIDINKLLELDKERRKIIQEVEKLRAKQNKISGQRTMNNEQKRKAKQIKDKIKKIEPKLGKIDKEFNELMLQIPNLPLNDTPAKNKIIKKEGKATKGGKNYLEIAEKLDIIDVKRAAKVSSSRFGYLKKEAVLLEFALIQLAFDTLTKEGFVPVIPPAMIKPEMMRGMGYMERGGEEMYHISKDDLYLTGTAEQSIGPMHSNEVFNEKDLPKRYLAFSPCFRREAGSYGKDTKGILRVHQFDKVEMFSFCKPENSLKEHKFFLSMQEKLMKLLKIPYQVVQVSADDLSDPAAAQFDIEAWMPSQGKYRETHSTSNCTDFQARRLNIRYKGKKGTEFVHTINGTAFAIGRTIIAIIENYQQKDGSIKIPQSLQRYIKIKELK